MYNDNPVWNTLVDKGMKEKELAEKIGEQIAKRLNEVGMSQRELADLTGITEVSMSRYIRGERIPNGIIVAKIATALHTTSDELLGSGKTEEDPELAYYRVQRVIARNVRSWTAKQRADLCYALFDV